MEKTEVFVLMHVTGYTSEAEVAVFNTIEDARLVMQMWVRDSLGIYLNLQHNITLKEMYQFTLERLEKMEIFLKTDDIEWEGFEVYERIFITKKELF